MKVVFLSTFYPYRGGIAQFNALIYREIEKKYHVEAITFQRQYPAILFPGKTQLVSDADAADKIPSKRWLDSILPWTYVRTAQKIRQLQPNLIVTKYWMTFFAPSLGYVLGRQKKDTIRISILDNVIPHEKRFFDNWCNHYFLNQNDGFIVMSEKVLKDLLHYRPDAKYIHVPHPVYNQFGEKIAREESLKKLGIAQLSTKKILLFFGIIRDYKGLDLLLDAMALLTDEFHLIVAGEVYGSFQKYQTSIENHFLSDRVSLFTNYIDDAAVKDYFSAADVCILPYKSATQSGITSIANHFELPIIATNVGGLAETIEHQKTGLVIDPADVNLLAEAIQFYFLKQLKKQFEENIRAENSANSWSNFSDKLMAFYHELKKSST